MKTLFEYIKEARKFFSLDIPIEKLEDIFQLISKDDFDNYKEINILIKELNEYNYNIDTNTLNSILFAYFWSKNGMNGKYSK